MNSKKKILILVFVIIDTLVILGLAFFYFGNIHNTYVGNSRISPDGKTIAYERIAQKEGQTLVLINLRPPDSKEERTIFHTAYLPGSFSTSIHLMGFSPDGKSIYIGGGNYWSMEYSAMSTLSLQWQGEKTDIKPSRQENAHNENPEETNEEGPDGNIYVFPGEDWLTMEIEDLILESPTLGNMLTETSSDNLDFFSKIQFNKNMTLHFKDKPYYLMVSSELPKILKRSPDTIEPHELDIQLLQDNLGISDASYHVWLTDREKNILFYVLGFNQDYRKVIRSIRLLRGDRVVLRTESGIQVINPLTYKREKEITTQDFACIKNTLDGKTPFVYSQVDAFYDSTGESDLFYTDGGDIISFNPDNGEEKKIYTVKGGGIHNLTISQEGKAVGFEVFNQYQNTIMKLDPSTGTATALATDERRFIYPQRWEGDDKTIQILRDNLIQKNKKKEN